MDNEKPAGRKSCHVVVTEQGTRLDRYAAEKCPGLSRAQAQKLIESGDITINGRMAKASHKLDIGDEINIVIPPSPPSVLEPEAIPLEIIYEDDDLMVIDKPPGLTVHPAPGHPRHTLVNAILSHLSGLPGGSLRPGIVHRLDKDTSGLMVIAKNLVSHASLSEQFKSRSVVKVYQVLVQGHLSPQQGIIEADIGRDPRDRKRMAVAARGREARTEYRVLRYVGEYTLLEVGLKTGRTHQIRVHLGAIGFPVVGDSVYGVKSPYLSRQFVHAYRLGFHLPSSGEYIEFTAELPADLGQALERISNLIPK